MFTAISILFSVTFASAIAFTPTLFIITIFSVLIFVFFGKILETIEKHTPTSFSKKYMTMPNLYAFLGFSIILVYVCTSAIRDAHEVKANPAHIESRLIDVLEVGYLKQIGMSLILEDRSGNTLVNVKIREYDNRSVACRLGLDFACF